MQELILKLSSPQQIAVLRTALFEHKSALEALSKKNDAKGVESDAVKQAAIAEEILMSTAPQQDLFTPPVESWEPPKPTTEDSE